MSTESRLRIKVLIQDEEEIGADVTLNYICVDRASGMVSANFCSHSNARQRFASPKPI